MSKRLQRELNYLLKKPIDGVSIQAEDLTQWTITVQGPTNSLYEQGVFKFIVHFKNDYPFSSPEIRSTHVIFHPNISLNTGELCLKVLSDWSIRTTMIDVINDIKQLLSYPNPDNPVCPEIGKLYNQNFDEFVHKVNFYIHNKQTL